jgi:hypothetical protein
MVRGVVDDTKNRPILYYRSTYDVMDVLIDTSTTARIA